MGSDDSLNMFTLDGSKDDSNGGPDDSNNNHIRVLLEEHRQAVEKKVDQAMSEALRVRLFLVCSSLFRAF